MKEVTKEVAEKVFEAIKKQFAPYIDGEDEKYGPKLVENWDWLDSGPTRWAIVWEEGPFEWALHAHEGGVDEELTAEVQGDAPGHVIKTPEAEDWPKEAWTEAATSWAVGIYPA